MSLNSTDFDSVVNDTLMLCQEYLDQANRDLYIHRLTDDNFDWLIKEEYKISWSNIITNKLTIDGDFDFGLTWQTENKLVAALIAAYKPDEQCLEVYGIEQFNFPVLDGRMMPYSIYFCSLLLEQLDGKYIKVVDVEQDNQALRDYYKSFGFKKYGDKDLILEIEELPEKIQEIK